MIFTKKYLSPTEKTIINTDKNRFYSKTLIPDEKGCMRWTGILNETGEPVFYDTKRNIILSHIFSFNMYKGYIPNYMNVIRSCNDNTCVAPDHLKLI